MTEPNKIMTKPLPEILDGLEEYQEALKSAVEQANKAAQDAYNAAAKAVMDVEIRLVKRIEALTKDLNDAKHQTQKLMENVASEAVAVDKAMAEAKNIHSMNSPFLEH
jgi:hypothetical protein